MVWNVGNEKDIDFWKSPWVSDIGSLVDWVLLNVVLPSDFTLLNSMVAPNWDWLWHRFEHLLPLSALLRIAAIKAPVHSALTNSLGGMPNSDRSFTVRTAYRLHMGFVDDSVDPYWKVIVQFPGSQRVKSFLWLLAHGRILTNVERHHLTSDVRCGIYGRDTKSLDHLFRFYLMASLVWRCVVWRDRWVEFCTMPFKDWLGFNLAKSNLADSNREEWPQLFAYILWLIWKHRNSLVFDSDFFRTEPILVTARRLLHEYKSASSLSVGHGIHYRSHGTPRVEERWTCPVEGLHHAWSMNLRRVWNEVDNANVDWEVRFSHVRREANTVVNCLAKYGFTVDRGGQLFSHPPDFALNVFLDDCRLLSV
ncbi:hypothetical protein V6N11_080116 [Hibiscus sabdariffa]|uniref:Reverse transcriptase zinc-binding domain-containing protein n=1 Tax=Hibiscus sabdariffa TaxID=183260 RepID=A0ABR2RXA3_9ROSI